MKVKINQLDEQVNESNTDFIVQRLKKENDQLHQLVNKYHESKNANRKSDDLKTKKVNIFMNSVHYMYKLHTYIIFCDYLNKKCP